MSAPQWIAQAAGYYKSRSSFLRAFREVHGYVPAESEGRTELGLKTQRRAAAAAGKACRDAVVPELRSMINGYRIDSHTAFPFVGRRRHPPTNSHYAIKADVLWHTTSGGSAGARVGGMLWRDQLRWLDARGNVCGRSPRTVLNLAGATLAGAAAFSFDPLSLRLTEALAKSDVVDLDTCDIALLNNAYVLEQLEAAFYTAVMASPYSGMSRNERSVLSDVKGHEITDREFFRKALGGSPSQKPFFAR